MKDQPKKLQELKKDSSVVFEGIFGKKAAPQKGNGQVQIIGIGKYRMGNSLITKVHGASEAGITNYDFANSDLDWLLDAKFEGILNLDLDRGVLKSFSGRWMEGVFKGLVFGNGSTFEGGQFGDGITKPVYHPPFVSWKTSPLNFIDGTINRETGGILGIPDAPNGETDGVNIISIQPGKSLIIKLKNNIIHKVNFKKRIDNLNSDFTIETVNGETGEIKGKTFDWANSKQSLNKPFYPYKSQVFLGLDLSVGVISATIATSGRETLSHKPEGDKSSPSNLSKEQQQFNLSDMPFLGIPSIPRGKGGTPDVLYFNFPTANHQNGHAKVVNSIKSGWIKSYLTQIKTALEQGVIKGAPATHQYLSNVIGKDADADLKAMDQDLVNSLNGMENFLKYFVETMVRRVRKSGTEKGLTDVVDAKGKEAIKNRLKELVGLSNPIQNKPANKPATKAGSKLKNKFLKESVVDAVREIISKNMKHF
jgi:hypothetical protein